MQASTGAHVVALRSFEDGRTTIAELARKLGYRSEAAFAWVFKRVPGVSPGAARKRRENVDVS